MGESGSSAPLAGLFLGRSEQIQAHLILERTGQGLKYFKPKLVHLVNRAELCYYFSMFF